MIPYLWYPCCRIDRMYERGHSNSRAVGLRVGAIGMSSRGDEDGEAMLASFPFVLLPASLLMSSSRAQGFTSSPSTLRGRAPWSRQAPLFVLRLRERAFLGKNDTRR